jgi:protocatechuate 3,4-dioxygenase beta subunit
MPSRRVFLGVVVGVAGRSRLTGQQGLEQFAVSSPSCTTAVKVTPPVPLDATYRPGAPARTSLLEPGLTGTRFTLTGTVAGRTCGRIKGAEMEFWQADARGVYDVAGFRLRGRQHTDADGRYLLVTIAPGAPPGRARHIGLRVRVAGKADLPVLLFFPDDPQNRRDPRFRPELTLTMTRATTGLAASFDVLLDI